MYICDLFGAQTVGAYATCDPYLEMKTHHVAITPISSTESTYIAFLFTGRNI